ncbi:MAG: YCF48-related protein, partial [bacterium]
MGKPIKKNPLNPATPRRGLRFAPTLFVLLLIPFLSWSQWNWVNPLPGPDWYMAMDFTSSGPGFALGVQGNLIKTNDAGFTWTEVVPKPIPEGYYTDMLFADQNTGLITGVGGVILRSGDGGVSWSSISSGTGHDLRSLSMPDPLHGYITGNQGTILKTDDGGISWDPVPTITTSNFTDNCFTDSLTGYIAAGKYLFRTTNGCSSWDTVFRSESSWSFDKLFALNDSTIFVTTGQGFLFRTTDVGKSWTRLNTGPNNHFGGLNDGLYRVA